MKRSCQVSMAIAIAIILICTSTTLIAAYDSQGVELVDRYPYGYCRSAIGYGDYVVVGNGTALEIVDHQTMNPVGEIVTESIVSGIVIVDTFAFVSNWSDGFKVINIADPVDPFLVDELVFEGQCWHVTVFGNYAYVGNDVYGLRIIDISDPGNVELVGTFQSGDAKFEYAQVIDNIAYVASLTGLYILDLSDPSHPTQLSYSHSDMGSYQLHVANGVAYIPEFGAGVRILDVSNPSYPVDHGHFEIGGWSNWFQTKGDYGFVSTGMEGLKILDLSSPIYPSHVGTVEAKNADASSIQGDTLYLSTTRSGMTMIDISTPADPVEIGEYLSGHYSRGVYMRGDYAYVQNLYNGIGIYKVFNTNGIELVNLIEMGNPHATFDASGDHLFVSDGGDTVRVIDISDPPNASVVHSFPSGGFAALIRADGDRLYIGGWPLLSILNITDPMNPYQLGVFTDLPGNIRSIDVVGSQVYCATGSGGFQIIDIQDPGSPVLMGSNPEFDYAFSVSSAGSYAYVSDRYTGQLKVIDSSDPHNPIITDSIQVGDLAQGVIASGRYAYVIDPWSGMRVIDCGNPYNLREVGYFNTGGYAQGVYGVDGNLIVSDGGGGLYSLQTAFHQAQYSAPALAVAADSLYFGSTFIGFGDTLILEFQNIGSSAITVSNLMTTDPAYSANLTGFQLQPMEKKSVKVAFSPLLEQWYLADLTFQSTDPLLATGSVALTGHGVLPPSMIVSIDSLNQALYSGNKVLDEFTISNAGGSDLQFRLFEKQSDGIELATLLKENADARRFRFLNEGGQLRLEIQEGRHLSKPELSPQLQKKITPAADNYLWDLILEDPNEPENYLDIHRVYGSSAGDELLFKFTMYESWDPYNESFYAVFMDVDQNPATGFQDDYFGGDRYGVDYAIAHNTLESHSVIVAWDESAGDFLEIGELSTTILDNVGQAVILGLPLDIIQNPEVVNIFSYAYYDGGRDGSIDFAPDEGMASYSLGIPWISTDIQQGTVPVGGSEVITVEFLAENMKGGDYYGSLLVNSNDPAQPELDIPIHLEVTGAPNIITELDTLDFGDSFINVSHTLPAVVYNNGSDDLLIFSSEVSSGEFSVTPAYAGVDPADTDTFFVSFIPPAVGDYTATLTLNSNDPDNAAHVVYLKGTGIEPPIFTHAPDSFYVALFTGDQELRSLELSNGGGSDLLWDIQLEGIGTGSVTITKADYADWTLPANQDRISDGVWITRQERSGLFNIRQENDHNYNSPRGTEWAYGKTAELVPEDYQYWRDAVYPPPSMVGNPLSLHLINEDMYYDVMFHSWTEGGNGGGFSYTRTDVRPKWLMLTEREGVLPMDSTLTLDLTFDATDMLGGDYYGDIVVETNDPHNALVNIPLHLNVTGIPDIQVGLSIFEETSMESWSNYAAVTDHIFTSEISPGGDGNLVVGVAGDFNSSSEYAEIYVDGNMLGMINPNQFEYSSKTFVIPQNELEHYLEDGTIHVSVMNSQSVGVGYDPEYHEVTLSFAGPGDSLAFGEVFQGDIAHRKVVISNNGTDTLKLSNVSVDLEVFSLSASRPFLKHGESDTLIMSFASPVLGSYSGALTVVSNDPDEGNLVIPVTGSIVEPPIMSLSHDSLLVSLQNEQQVTRHFTISNTGGSDLDYDIMIDYLGQYDNENKAVRFDGNNGYVEIPDNESLNPQLGITISLWIYLERDTDCDGNNNYRSIIYKGWTCCVHDGYDILLEDDGHLSFDVGTLGNPMRYASGVQLPIKQWTHLTCTYDANTSVAKMYFNGNEIPGEHGPGEHGSGAIIRNWASLNLTHPAYSDCPGGGSGNFPGRYDEVRLWDYAQNEDEIRRTMFTELTGSEPGLLGSWSFNDDGSVIHDRSPYGNDGYMHGGVALIPSTAPIRRWVMVEDRSGTIASGTDHEIPVLFEGIGPASTTYDAMLHLSSNDPAASVIMMPLQMQYTVVAIDAHEALPREFTLEQNYPNPFNPVTTIKYGLPEDSQVSVAIYDISGREIARIVQENQTAGWYQFQWNGTDTYGDPCGSGVYLCRIIAGDFVETIKMVFLK